jgi:hypothetical protein
MIWAISQFPELDHLTDNERAQLLGDLPRWTYWVLVGRSLLLGFFVGGLSAGLLFRSTTPEILIATHLLIAASAAAAYYLTQLHGLRRLMRAEIATGFHNQRPPFCFHCGYDLRASAALRCPECGHETTPAPSPSA